MKVESGFLGGKHTPYEVDENESLRDFHLLTCSKTGFFRILLGKHLGRKVVLKTLKEEAKDNPVAVAQLKKEFSALFPLSSVHVAQAFRLTKLEDGTPAIEMEWCDGANIRAMMTDKVSARDALEIVRGLLRGLQDIHAAGIIHRDIKPENVMYDPFRKVVKIIDFGCAYITGGLVLQGANGTEGYTPREKMKDGCEPEPKDDLYALGVMIAEMTESLDAGFGEDVKIKKVLNRLSKQLIAGKFLSAHAAANYLDTILKKKRWNGIYIITLIGIASALLFFYLHNNGIPKRNYPNYATDIAPHALNGNTAVTEDNPAPLKIQDTIEEPLTLTGVIGGKSPVDNSILDYRPVEVKDTLRQVPKKSKPVQSTNLWGGLKIPPGVSLRNNAAVFKITIPVDRYSYVVHVVPDNDDFYPRQGVHTSMEVKSHADAFVIQYCDSVYLKDRIYHEIPTWLRNDDMNKYHGKFVSWYKTKMEKAFCNRFGEKADIARADKICEGRLFEILYALHAFGSPDELFNNKRDNKKSY